MRLRAGRLLVVVALAAALLLVARPPLHVQHPAAAFRNAACLCPLCVVTDGLLELSWSEYC